MWIFILWILLCPAIGNWSQNKFGSFSYGFFISLLLSPLIGIIAVAARDAKRACDHCGFESRNNFDFCPACRLDSRGNKAEDYQQGGNSDSDEFDIDKFRRQ
jgi:hypothetical protein